MDQNRNYESNFALNTYDLLATATPGVGGSISGTGNDVVDHGGNHINSLKKSFIHKNLIKNIN